ncbi:MAG: MOSC domain-containing protein [Cytophagaceae bacterium]|nr:MOSC domain-containing protein [Cytophagaceae bacterium]
MKIKALNVGLPRTVQWKGKSLQTGIFKSPVEGPLRLVGHNFQGDQQADLRVHGGANKAVYAYDRAHYDFWEMELPDYEFTDGNFGENLTTEGLPDEVVRLGDQFCIGSAVLMAVQPRFPCCKLGLRFNDPTMVKRFAKALRHGIYFRVVVEGSVQAGDAIELLKRSDVPATVQDVVNAFYGLEKDKAKLAAMLNFPHLPRYVREALRRK